jgi:DMSO/TMAO reductase YedYZ molybdopterin-dependent catalytic subunit
MAFTGTTHHISEDTFRLRIHGAVDKSLALSINDLKTQFAKDSMLPLLRVQVMREVFLIRRFRWSMEEWCAMGNAKWTGVRLKAILEKAGLKKEAFEVLLMVWIFLLIPPSLIL